MVITAVNSSRLCHVECARILVLHTLPATKMTEIIDTADRPDRALLVEERGLENDNSRTVVLTSFPV